MNREDYVSYPLALALKKAGFDLKVNHVYDKNGEFWEEGMNENAECDYTAYFNYNKSGYVEVSASAPTLAQAQKWLREVKELIICVEPRFYRGRRPLVGYSFHINEKENRPFTYIESEAPSNTYEGALSAGITAALELIEKKGE